MLIGSGVRYSCRLVAAISCIPERVLSALECEECPVGWEAFGSCFILGGLAIQICG